MQLLPVFLVSYLRDGVVRVPFATVLSLQHGTMKILVILVSPSVPTRVRDTSSSWLNTVFPLRLFIVNNFAPSTSDLW